MDYEGERRSFFTSMQLFLDDNARNIAAGNAVGLQTVLVQREIILLARRHAQSHRGDFKHHQLNGYTLCNPFLGTFGGIGTASLLASLLTSVLPTTLEDLLALGICSVGGYIAVANFPVRRKKVVDKVKRTADSLARKLEEAMQRDLLETTESLENYVKFVGTLVGLIAVAQGCPNIEYLHFNVEEAISNEALECIGTNLKNLRDFNMKVGEIEDNTTRDLLLDNGIRTMLIGCTKLERLGIHLYATAYLTDVGLGFIGKYGVNLRFLSLSRIGESDEGLLELSKGCPKLRKLRMMDCPFSKQAVTGFVFNIHPLRYTWGQIRICGDLTDFSATCPNFKASTIAAQVLTKPKLYLTLAEKLGKLAGQLLAGGSGMKSAKVTYAIGGAPKDLETRLLCSMVAKGIHISEERVILHGSSKKPLDIIQIEIADVESCFASAISESRVIRVEGKLIDGVPHLTKLGAFEVVVSLIGYSHIILCRQVDQPARIIRSIRSILDDENKVYVRFTSVGRTPIAQQAVMMIVVDREPTEMALKRISKIPAVKEVVFLSL